jgi:hypothetical protein
MDKWYPALS